MIENSYPIEHIAELLNVEFFELKYETLINTLLIDSRSVRRPDTSLFFALSADRDGHEFIGDAYASGIRSFVISNPAYANTFPDANFLLVPDVLEALQQLAIDRRSHFDYDVLAITGSNGKTIVKEWLYQLLASDYNIVRSPKSFNSQIGVPLSVWQINNEHTLGIFEAGISKNGEMGRLAEIIQPTIGILTNIGEAHAEGFSSAKEKLAEKLKLFNDVNLFIYSPDYTGSLADKKLPGRKKFSWSTRTKADLEILFVEPIKGRSYLRAVYKKEEIECLIPFSDRASVENGIICWATLLALGYTPQEADLRLEKLTAVNMRLELKNGINQCSVIDDSYSADISSLAIALDFLRLQNQHLNKTLILSDIYETGKTDQDLYTEIAALLKQKQVNRLVGVGPHIKAFAQLFPVESLFFESTQDFVNNFPAIHFANETILVKGARRFEFERISKLLTQKVHDTVMEIDLSALAGNLKFYKSKLKPGVKVMAMVKAFSYGSGSFEIANLLQYHKVDFLAVAYADEGIALRKAGITLPIMIMSPEPYAFEAILKYKLEPELYNLDILKAFIEFLPDSQYYYPVHLKLDTGMHRLGFEEPDLTSLLPILVATDKIKIVSAFSHFVASEDPQHDEFTKYQIQRYLDMSIELRAELGYDFIRHISNTSGITRHPEAQLDMVRIGIGLYGFDGGLKGNQGLQTVAILKTTITQIKTVGPLETVGYGRRGILPEGGTIATVKIGYADGYRRSFGNGVGKMLVAGKPVPTVGSIAMDMCMLDITGLDVKTGDEVVVFNDQLTIADLAEQIDTIPYEILTNISQRVKRVYFYE
ncbi:bifunctional UDP-N-acetylmuramoyl-tripeptide:D-alanyl-D-alanine ligase/alanine racemase [Pedobacter sp. L105]|uniref:bifunctional UDP-N-acetylmuramoyl-tripeptide:D-alanyl-D-alanine ligase/alanine racemase n=1 Tax=Pedobacter sp. L105 TaxID=1641871 RepID=UPI00131AD7E3|nr:bifunctional UDP-N-acetylmuramoyl-tripeptide:D-alanyl-D-alanine ligase/alanine racemase [Pedobacter sp. L105]